ncbi:MAG TPA: response regulator transcription factor [Gammaproteobacteria bacterium]|nr:response regulator transcription factor [Gammaproteobacteria bacterium]
MERVLSHEQSKALNGSFTALVATGDPAIAAVVQPLLVRLHFEVRTVADDGSLADWLGADEPDMLLLDNGLPPAGGLEVCRRLRDQPRTARLPIIVMATRGNGSATIQALEAGADDCIGTPWEADAIAARIKALARRALVAPAGEHLRAGPIDMDLARWTASVNRAPVDLTKTEFKLLRALLEARGRTLTREQLLRMVWSHANAYGLNTRTVDVHMGRLRRKLGFAGPFIITVRNVGFRFEIMADWIAEGRAS